MHHRITSTVLCLAALAAACALAPATARADRDYSVRFGTVDRGDVTIASNTILTCPAADSSCAGAQAGTGPTLRNSSYVMTHVDVDSDASTFNSSSADLVLPADATVLFAGLYWGSDVAPGAGGVAAPDPAAKGTVLLATGSTWSYSPVTATQIDVSRSFGGTRYQGFADVTQRVRAAGAGRYTVANIQAATGSDNFGGWGLVVAYRAGAKPVRWLGVYDGFIQFVDNTRQGITLGGFDTPSTGTVGADFGIMVYEGDLAVTNDSVRINGRDVGDALHPVDNYFNSRITAYGNFVQTKNPNYAHQLGHEASIVDVDGYLSNGARSAELSIYSESDYLQTGPMTIVSEQASLPPTATAAPSVSGAADEGSTLTATTGIWSGNQPMTFAFQWLRCGDTCADIAGARGATYELGAADVGSTIGVRVTATNVSGSASAESALTGRVAPSAGTRSPGTEPGVSEPRLGESPAAACDALRATYAGRTLRLRLRLVAPSRNVQFQIPAALLPTRAAAGRRVVGRMRRAGATGPFRSLTLRFRRTSKLGLTPRRNPQVRLIRGGARVTGLARGVRRLELALTTRRAASVAGMQIVALTRSAGGGLQRFTCTMPARG